MMLYLLQVAQAAAATTASLPGSKQLLLDWITNLLVVDSVHEQQVLQQKLIGMLEGLRDGISFQGVQQLQDILDRCCGGALPPTQHQLSQLSVGKEEQVCQAKQAKQQQSEVSQPAALVFLAPVRCLCRIESLMGPCTWHLSCMTQLAS
jgi:hypothetical protein